MSFRQLYNRYFARFYEEGNVPFAVAYYNFRVGFREWAQSNQINTSTSLWWRQCWYDFLQELIQDVLEEQANDEWANENL